MPTYEISFADGTVADVEAPEGASEQEILDSYYSAQTARNAGAIEELGRLERRGAIRDTGPLGQFVRGLGAGAVGMTGTALQGAAELLPDEYEEPVQEGIAGLVDYLTPENLVREDEGSTAQQIAAGFGQALGSTIPLLGAAAVGGVPAAAALGAGAGAGEAGQRARRAGATDEEQMIAVLQGTGVGLTEAGPLGAISRLFRPATKAASIIAPKLDPGWRAKAKAAYDYTVRRAGPAAAEEAAQESIASSLQNAIERGYNPEQDIFDAGVFEEGAYGAGVGATIQALADLAIRGRNRRIISEAYAEDEARDAQSARDAKDGADSAMAEEAAAAPTTITAPGRELLERNRELLARDKERLELAQARETSRALDEAEFADDTFVENLIDQAEPGEQFDFLAGDMAAVPPREDLGLDERAPAEAPVPERVVSGAQRDAQTVDMIDVLEETELRTLLEQEEATAQAAEQAAEQARARAEQTRLASDIETTDARVRDAEAARSRAARLRILQDVIETTPTRQTDTLTKAFQQALKDRGVRQAPLPAERRLIKRAIDFQRAQPVDQGPVPSSADLAALESAVPERRTAAEAPTARTPEEQLGLDLGSLPEQAEEAPTGPRPVRSVEEALAGRRPLPPQRLTAERLSELGVPEAREARPGRRPTPGTTLRAAVEGKDINEPGVQDALAEFVRASKGQQVATNIARILNATPEAQAEMFPAPAEARRRDRPVEPPASERREQAPRGLTEEELAIPEATEEAAPETAQALFSETAIQDAERQNPKSRELLVEMPITEFLSLAKGMGARDVGKTKTVKDVIDAGGQFDSVPLLKFEANRDGEAAVTGHEGRHRALALQDLGYTTLPVRLISSEGGGVSIRWGGQTNPKSYDYVQTYPETLTNEDGDTTVPFPVPRDAYAKQVTERWQPLQEPTADAGQPQQTKAAPEAQSGSKSAAEPEQEAPPASERPSEPTAALAQEDSPPITTKELEFLKSVGRSGPDQGGQEYRQAAYQYLRDFGVRAFRAMGIDAMLGDPNAEKGLLWLTKNMGKRVKSWVRQDLERIRAELVEADQAGVSDVVQDAAKRSNKYMAERLKLQEAYAETDDVGVQIENDVDDANAILKRSPKNALAVPLSPEVETTMLADGVTPALQAMAKQLRSPVMRSISRRIAAALQGSGVSVQVLTPAEMDAAYPKPGAPPGFYSEAQRTIYLNSASGLRNNVLLHEAVHAATVYFIKNRPNSAAVVALRKLFADVKPELGSAYGAENEVEFVSEMYSNPDFRSKMARLTPQGTKETVWQRFKNAVKRMLGFDAKSESLTTADSIVENIISGQLNVRDPGAIWKASSAGRGGQLVDDTYAFMPERTEQAVASLRANLQDPTIPEAAKEAVRFVQDLNMIKRTAREKFPMYADLEDILRRQQAYAQKLLSFTQETVRDANKWVKSVRNETMNVLGKQVSKKAGLSYLLSTSTRTETDMSRPRSYYEKAVADAEANLPSATAGSYISRLEAVEKAKERLAAYKIMEPWYQEIGPKGQETYKRSLNMFKRYKGELVDVLKEKLSRLPDSAVRNRLTKELVEKLENHGIDPYFPLVRNGRYWITYSANDPITGRNDTFITSFHTHKEREKAIQELEAQRDNIGLKGEVDKYNKLEVSNFRNAPPESFIGNVQKILADAGVDADVQASVLELYVGLLPERSFAKGLMHREGKRGSASDITPLTDITPQHDFIETLEQAGQRFTKQLATAKYVSEMADVENKAEEFMQLDANKADPSADGYYKDFMNRVKFAKRPDIASWSRVMTSSLYLYTMGLSPAAAALQLSTLPLVTYPMLGGKYGYRQSAAQIARSTSLLKNAGTLRKVERAGVDTVTETARESLRFIRSFGNYDLDAGKPENMTDAEYANLRVFTDVLSKYGELEHTVNADMLDLEGTRTNMWGRVQQLGGFMNHSTELASRQVSGHAYYELELAKIPNPTDADRVRVAKEAIEFMSETNSSTLSGGVAPMSQNDWLRVLAMFKRWPLSMLQLQMEVLKEVFAGETPKARRIARMQLAGMYGMAGLLAGATGAPLYGVFQMVFDALRDDDEEDFDTLVRTYMGEGFAKGIINYGLGVDIATRLAMTNFVFREPLIEQDSTLMNMLVMFGGPAIGVINNADRMASLWSQGEIWRGFEAGLPIVAKNVLRSVRFGKEGARTLNGDPIVEDIHPLHIAAQLIGLPPAEYIQQLEKNAALLGIDRAINEERTKLLQERNIAVRDGRSTRDIDRRIGEFGRKHPQAAIDPDTIRRSQQAYRRTAERRLEGAVFSELNDERMRAMAEAWGDPTFWN